MFEGKMPYSPRALNAKKLVEMIIEAKFEWPVVYLLGSLEKCCTDSESIVKRREQYQAFADALGNAIDNRGMQTEDTLPLKKYIVEVAIYEAKEQQKIYPSSKIEEKAWLSRFLLPVYARLLLPMDWLATLKKAYPNDPFSFVESLRDYWRNSEEDWIAFLALGKQVYPRYTVEQHAKEMVASCQDYTKKAIDKLLSSGEDIVALGAFQHHIWQSPYWNTLAVWHCQRTSAIAERAGSSSSAMGKCEEKIEPLYLRETFDTPENIAREFVGKGLFRDKDTRRELQNRLLQLYNSQPETLVYYRFSQAFLAHSIKMGIDILSGVGQDFIKAIVKDYYEELRHNYSQAPHREMRSTLARELIKIYARTLLGKILPSGFTADFLRERCQKHPPIVYASDWAEAFSHPGWGFLWETFAELATLTRAEKGQASSIGDKVAVRAFTFCMQLIVQNVCKEMNLSDEECLKVTRFDLWFWTTSHSHFLTDLVGYYITAADPLKKDYLLNHKPDIGDYPWENSSHLEYIEEPQRKKTAKERKSAEHSPAAWKVYLPEPKYTALPRTTIVIEGDHWTSDSSAQADMLKCLNQAGQVVSRVVVHCRNLLNSKNAIEMEGFLKWLTQLPQLIELDFTGSRLSNMWLEMICNPIKEGEFALVQKLRVLSLEGVESIDEEDLDLIPLFQSLQAAPKKLLETLNLGKLDLCNEQLPPLNNYLLNSAEKLQALILNRNRLCEFVRDEKLNQINLQYWEEFLKALGNVKNLKVVNFSANPLGAQALTLLLQALQQHANLTRVCLTNVVRVYVEEYSPEPVIQFLHEANRLRQFVFANNCLMALEKSHDDTRVAQQLAEALARNQLTHLDLSENMLSLKSARILAQGLRNNHSLTSLILNGNSRQKLYAQGISELVDALRNHPRLALLSLNTTGMKIDAEAIDNEKWTDAKAIDNSNWPSKNFVAKVASRIAVTKLADYLRENKAIRECYLRDNELDAVDVELLLEAMAMKESDLALLDLNGTSSDCTILRERSEFENKYKPFGLQYSESAVITKPPSSGNYQPREGESTLLTWKEGFANVMQKRDFVVHQVEMNSNSFFAALAHQLEEQQEKANCVLSRLAEGEAASQAPLAERLRQSAINELQTNAPRYWPRQEMPSNYMDFIEHARQETTMVDERLIRATCNVLGVHLTVYKASIVSMPGREQNIEKDIKIDTQKYCPNGETMMHCNLGCLVNLQHYTSLSSPQQLTASPPEMARPNGAMDKPKDLAQQQPIRQHRHSEENPPRQLAICSDLPPLENSSSREIKLSQGCSKEPSFLAKPPREPIPRKIKEEKLEHKPQVSEKNLAEQGPKKQANNSMRIFGGQPRTQPETRSNSLVAQHKSFFESQIEKQNSEETLKEKKRPMGYKK